jgi:hypothetical protein
MSSTSRHKFNVKQGTENPMIEPRLISKIRFSPPEIILAKNGYVLKSYDVHKDEIVYEVAEDIEQLRAVLGNWVDQMCGGLRIMVEKRIQQASSLTPRNSDAA